MTDRAALEALYRAANGPSWTDRTNWLSNAPLAEWFGVTTENGRVTRLNLPGNTLNGSLPAALGNLSSLQLLDLGRRWDSTSAQYFSNALTGPIPRELGGLTNLRSLSLWGNKLAGAIPPELGNLVNLDVLYLNGNALTGPVPNELRALVNLRHLVLWGNRLTGPIPGSMGTLTGLELLDLGFNRFSGPIPGELGNLASLRWLWLNDNDLTGRIPAELGNLAALETLYLPNNALTGPLPATLTRLSRLARFGIQGTGVCVSDSPAVQTWLAALSDFTSSGLACDGSVSVAFGASSYTVAEGGSVPVAVRLVDRSAGPPPSVTVGLTATPGRGATAADYAGVPARVTITAPDTAATFDFRALADDSLDDAETVVLAFRHPLPSGIAGGEPATATLVIVDPAGATADRAVLEALYHATNGPGWTDRTNWLSNAPLAEWFGVTTENGPVTRLNLPGNALSGPVPPALGNLPFLQALQLGSRWDPALSRTVYNHLTGSIPPELGRLANLRFLYLLDNDLTGSIPAALAGLGKLEYLYLWATR